MSILLSSMPCAHGGDDRSETKETRARAAQQSLEAIERVDSLYTKGRL